MLQDYPTTKSSKRCHLSGQEFAPGEGYFSVLVPNGDEISRIDIASTQWPQRPENAIGWWKCRMPKAKATGSRPAPNSVLLDTLTELLKLPEQGKLAYLLALLLVRRRVLIEEEKLTLHDDDDSAHVWNLVQPADGRQWQVPFCATDATEMSSLQQSLMKLLFTDE
jgi:hypothetical protein